MSNAFNIECIDCGARTDWDQSNWFNKEIAALVNGGLLVEFCQLAEKVQASSTSWDSISMDWCGTNQITTEFAHCQKHTLFARSEYGGWYAVDDPDNSLDTAEVAEYMIHKGRWDQARADTFIADQKSRGFA